MIIMLTGNYTEEQFQRCAHHLADLRKHNPDIGLHMMTGPRDDVGWSSMKFLTKRLTQHGETVKELSAQDFISWSINNQSNTLN